MKNCDSHTFVSTQQIWHLHLEAIVAEEVEDVVAEVVVIAAGIEAAVIVVVVVSAVEGQVVESKEG